MTYLLLNTLKDCQSLRRRGLLLVVILRLFCGQILAAQTTLFQSPTTAMLGTPGASEKGEWAFFSNPAGRAFLREPVATIGYQNDFNLKELSSATALLSYPTKALNISGGYLRSGFEHFNTQQLSLKFSRIMAPWLSLGLGFSHSMSALGASEQDKITTMDAGFRLMPNSSLVFGFYTINPAQTKWRKHEYESFYPSAVAASLSYLPHEDLNIEFSIQKDINNDPLASLKLEGKAANAIILRGAVSGKPLRLGFGAGLHLDSLRFDMAMNHHRALGFSSAFGISYYFENLSRKK